MITTKKTSCTPTPVAFPEVILVRKDVPMPASWNKRGVSFTVDDRRAANGRYKARRIAACVCLRCGEPVQGKAYCAKCTEIASEYARQRNKADKLFVIAHFGGKCPCGEDDVRCLTLDHIDGDGAEDRRRNGKKITSKEWLRVLASTLRKGLKHRCRLQLLCANCHFKKDSKLWWLRDE